MISVHELQIVGYADVLTKSTVPTIVPPVFQHIKKKEEFYFPPFSIKEDMLCNPTLSTEKDFDALIQAERITGFIGEPIPAQPDFELWVDETMEPRYERMVKVHEKLKALSKQYTADAETMIDQKKIPEAEALCNKAISAHGNNLGPWVIKAGIRLFQKKKDNADMLAETMAHLCPEYAFNLMAGEVSNRLGHAPDSPMAGIASETDEDAEKLFEDVAA
ncbi:MAG: hypothetical protein M0T82_06580 [Desulfobacteraceae bacterium]|nr:hypothetical protein [Desulfobacteraceae bacterium]